MDDSGPRKSPRKKAKFAHTHAAFDPAISVVMAFGNPNDAIDSATAKAASTTEDMATLHQTASTTRATMKDSTHLDSDPSNDQLSKEAACGITEFVSPDLLGFTGILKKRYTDFLVNEILPSGEVIHLTNLKAPKRKQPEPDDPAPVPLSMKEEAEDVHVESHDFCPKSSTTEDETETLHAEAQESARAGPTSSTTSGQRPPNSIATEVALTHLSTVEVVTKPQVGVRTKSATQESLPILEQEPKMMPGNSESHPFYQQLAASGSHEQTKLPLTSVAPQDPFAHNFEDISPHKRIPLSSALGDDKQNNPSTQRADENTRLKQKVHIRQTSQGWVEMNEEQEREMKRRETAEKAAGALQDDGQYKANQDEKTSQELPAYYTPASSTQAQWQAYAANSNRGNVSVPTEFQLKSEDKDILLSYFDARTVDDTLALYSRIVDSPHRKSKDYGTVKSGVIRREARTKIHQDIRRIFRFRLETMTDNDGALLITAMAENPKFNARTRNTRGNDQGKDRDQRRTPRGKQIWEELGGDYLHFSLYKENKDTMEAISWLSRQLNMSQGAFQFAGTKDRRGVTVQRVSVYRVFAERMIAAGRLLRGAKIGDFGYQPQSLQLGELTGNEFVITLRDCDFHYPERVDADTKLKGARMIVGEAIKNLGDLGFINYYGLQRFGTFSTSTDAVGVKMLQGDFGGAVDAILYFPTTMLVAAEGPAPEMDRISRDDSLRAQAIHLFKSTGKVSQALDLLPRKFSAESNIIRSLGRGQKSNPQDALQSISRNLRLMYVHAYQSLVWNMAVSERWKRFGTTVIEGDLVLIDEHREEKSNGDQAEDVDADGEAIVRPAGHDRAANAEDMFSRARALTKEEAESGKYTIFDIVLPTPGFDILYPANNIAKFYQEFMASERGGGLDPYDMRRQWKDVSLSGSYRKILAKPGKDISFEIRSYEGDDGQFVETDMDRLEKAKSGRSQNRSSKTHDGADYGPRSAADANLQYEPHKDHDGEKQEDQVSSVDNEQGGVHLDWNGNEKDNKKIAVILKLQLGSSQYATIALRELMKLGGVKTYKPDFGAGR